MIRQADSSTNNINKLPLEAVGMIYYLLKGEIEGFENAYMVEIKLDDPMKHIKEGDEDFIIHQSLDQYKNHAEHLWDTNWSTIHKEIFKNMTDVNEERFKTLLENYFKTCEIVKKENKENERNEGLQEVRRKAFQR